MEKKYQYICEICGKNLEVKWKKKKGVKILCRSCSSREGFKKINKETTGEKISQKNKSFYKKLKQNPEEEKKFWSLREKKSRETKIDKYGSLEGANKSMMQNLEKSLEKNYGEGVTNPMLSAEVRNKLKEVLQDKPESFWKEKDIKSKKTKIAKYGSLKEAEKKRLGNLKETCREKYGVDTPLQAPQIQQKIKETFVKKYGVNNPSKIPATRKKAERTIIERYGSWAGTVSNPQREVRKKELIEANKKKYRELDFSLKGFSYQENHQIPEVTCLSCGETFELTVPPSQIYTNLYCPFCNAFTTSSVTEREIAQEMSSWGLSIETSNRKILEGKELDIYIPELKLAVEYDGSFWHRWVSSSSFKGNIDKKYHLNKTNLAESKGVHLIHLFDDELKNKPDLTFNMLRRMTNKLPNKVFARKCTISEINNKDYANFLEDNHLQGYAPSKIRLGMYYQGILVSVISFSKPRFSKKYEWELIRYCEKQDYYVIGGREKLLAFFERNWHPLSIITYNDRRWFTGKGLLKSGFVFQKNTNPNYYYFKPGYNTFYNRIQFQKHKLKNLLEFEFDPLLTEIENMVSNGYSLIYDCGNSCYVKEYKH